LVFDAGNSNLAGGIARWGLLQQIFVPTVSGTSAYYARFTLTVPGHVLTASSGNVTADVTGNASFSGNLLFEVATSSAGPWFPAYDVYDNIFGKLSAPAITAVQVGFFYTTDPCAGVTCTASDQCHVVGTCNPATGLCSNPVKPNGTVC